MAKNVKVVAPTLVEADAFFQAYRVAYPNTIHRGSGIVDGSVTLFLEDLDRPHTDVPEVYYVGDAAPLEPMTDEEYVAKQGVVCPFCRSERIDGGDWDAMGEHAVQACKCDDCGREWLDQYRLIGYLPTD